MQRTTPESAGTPVDPLIDPDDLGQVLGVSGKTVRRMADRGRIPYYRAGDRYRFRASEVLAALRGGPSVEETA